MNLDFSKLIDLDGDELLRATEFPFDKKDDDFTINQWFIDSGLFYYIYYKLYNLPMPNTPATNMALNKLAYAVYAKLFEAAKDQLKDSKYFKSRCPESGEFYGYKFVMLEKDYRTREEFGIGIVKLRIPKEAKRVSPYFGTGKCRCDKAFVMEIRRMKVKRNLCAGSSIFGRYDMTYYKDDSDFEYFEYFDNGYSYHDLTFKYTIGDEPVTVENFDESRWHECTNGIHFFMTPEEAVNFASMCDF